jgi:hypothetical protein|tara:strand:+ start:14168 stop:14806 length:639 start_codon:yes stop_codon:yes gene_type:complete
MRIVELNVAKASSPKPKIVKPNKGASSKHPMRGKLVGEDAAVESIDDLWIVTVSNNGKTISQSPEIPKNKTHLYINRFQELHPGAKVMSKKIREGNRPQKPKPYSSRNPVAKNIEKFNRPVTHKDKKKELKKKGPSINLDEAPFVVTGSQSIPTAINRTKEWLEDQFYLDGEFKINTSALQKLGDLVGFNIERRGEKSITFSRFFTQTEDNS